MNLIGYIGQPVNGTFHRLYDARGSLSLTFLHKFQLLQDLNFNLHFSSLGLFIFFDFLFYLLVKNEFGVLPILLNCRHMLLLFLGHNYYFLALQVSFVHLLLSKFIQWSLNTPLVIIISLTLQNCEHIFKFWEELLVQVIPRDCEPRRVLHR